MDKVLREKRAKLGLGLKEMSKKKEYLMIFSKKTRKEKSQGVNELRD